MTVRSPPMVPLRWVFLPLGLLALIAVGIHAAADTVDDRLLWLMDHADAAFDALVSHWALTRPMVDWVGPQERIAAARALAFAWELAADVVLALPALGYEERPMQEVMGLPQRAPGAFLRLLRPLAAACIVLAGGCAVGRLVQGSVYLSLEGPFGHGIAGWVARACALGALAAVVASLGGRAIARTYEHARQVGHLKRAALETLIVAPLALAAWVDATPLMSFLR